MQVIDERALIYVAGYFKALAEPTRLKLVHALQNGEKNVGELTDMSGCTQANVSKHLSVLTTTGLVKREARGNSVFYSIADPSIYNLCELVCGQIGNKLAAESEVKSLFIAALNKADATP